MLAQIPTTGMADQKQSCRSTAIRLQSSRQSQSKSPSGKQCILCSRMGQYMTRFANWRESEKGFVVKHLGSNPPETYGVSHSGSIASVELNLEVGDSTVKFSSRWMLNQLIIYLHPYMEYKCVHRKYGTMLFRRGGDLLTSLSLALGALSTKVHNY